MKTRYWIIKIVMITIGGVIFIIFSEILYIAISGKILGFKEQDINKWNFKDHYCLKNSSKLELRKCYKSSNNQSLDIFLYDNKFDVFVYSKNEVKFSKNRFSIRLCQVKSIDENPIVSYELANNHSFTDVVFERKLHGNIMMNDIYVKTTDTTKTKIKKFHGNVFIESNLSNVSIGNTLDDNNIMFLIDNDHDSNRFLMLFYNIRSSRYIVFVHIKNKIDLQSDSILSSLISIKNEQNSIIKNNGL